MLFWGPHWPLEHPISLNSQQFIWRSLKMQRQYIFELDFVILTIFSCFLPKPHTLWQQRPMYVLQITIYKDPTCISLWQVDLQVVITAIPVLKLKKKLSEWKRKLRNEEVRWFSLDYLWYHILTLVIFDICIPQAMVNAMTNRNLLLHGPVERNFSMS